MTDKYGTLYTSRNCLEQLLQLRRIVWDGDLISKSDRDHLVKNGLAVNCEGYNLINQEGIRLLVSIGAIHA